MTKTLKFSKPQVKNHKTCSSVHCLEPGLFETLGTGQLHETKFGIQYLPFEVSNLFNSYLGPEALKIYKGQFTFRYSGTRASSLVSQSYKSLPKCNGLCYKRTPVQKNPSNYRQHYDHLLN